MDSITNSVATISVNGGSINSSSAPSLQLPVNCYSMSSDDCDLQVNGSLSLGSFSPSTSPSKPRHFIVAPKHGCPSLLHRLLLGEGPADVLFLILSGWLSLLDVATLDTAVSEKSLRTPFLQALAAPEAVLHCSAMTSASRDAVTVLSLQWLLRRHISIDRLVLRPLPTPLPSPAASPVVTRGKTMSSTSTPASTGTPLSAGRKTNAVFFPPSPAPLTSPGNSRSPRSPASISVVPPLPPPMSPSSYPSNPAVLWQAVLADKESLKRVLRRVNAIQLDSAAMGISASQAATLLGSIDSLSSVALKGFKKLDDAVILDLVRRSRGLTHVDLNGCWQVSDGVVEELVRRHGQTLVSLDLTACFNVTAASLVSLSTQCPALKSFCCALSSAVTDEVVLSLLTHCRALHSLSLTGCLSLSNAIGDHVAMHGGALQTLDVSGVKNLSDDFLLSLSLSAAKSLQTVNMEGCALVTTAGVKQLITRYPSLKKLHVRSCLNVVHRDLVKEVQEIMPDHAINISV